VKERELSEETKHPIRKVQRNQEGLELRENSFYSMLTMLIYRWTKT